MSGINIVPEKYKSALNFRQTLIAIKDCKEYFAQNLSKKLNLIHVAAPLIIESGNGINDNLNGIERVVQFDCSDIKNKQIEITQSLAKWKRMALSQYRFISGEGLYTNMNAIRRDEKLDNLHSIYVDQWDWEKVINEDERNIDYLKETVKKIYQVIKSTENFICHLNKELHTILPETIFFITTQELENMYPQLTPKMREDVIAKEHGAVFISKIGGVLRSGEKHDGRSPDYDDWELNGDIIFWYPPLHKSLEISSMGIRVDKNALLKQLKQSDCEERLELQFHKAIVDGKLPFTIGGGIGQSRLCMFLLQKAHIGEVQASVWHQQIVDECQEAGIILL